MNESKIPLPSELQAATPVNGNPLSQYFRHIKITVELPSRGKFWPPGSIDLAEDGTIGVMPLTATDEILLKSPEGLLSGSSIVSSIVSCVPSIKNPWLMPAIDVDTVFIAIRLASFNHTLEVSSECKHCGHNNDNALDLRTLLDSIPKGNIQNKHIVNGLTFEFAPYTFEFINKQGKMKFEQEQFARGLSGATSADEVLKSDYYKKVFQELAAHNTEAIVVAISSITLPDGVVIHDSIQITEFITNTDRETIKQIRVGIDAMNKSSAMQPMTIECEECEKSYETTVEFNQTNFFE